MMIELVRVHRADHQHVVRAGGKMRQKITELHAALAMSAELARRAEQNGRFLLDEGEPYVLDQRLGKRLTIQLVELGLGIEQIDLAGSPFQKDENALLGF